MKVDVLFFQGCPNHPATVALVRHVAQALGIEVEIREIEVKDPEEAARLRFLGSPTVQVDGEDIEPPHLRQTEYMMSCRLYGVSGVPPRGLIESALMKKPAHDEGSPRRQRIELGPAR